MIDSILIFHIWDKNDFGIASAHLLQSLQIAYLHCRLGIQLLSRQPHQFSRLDICLCRYDLALR